MMIDNVEKFKGYLKIESLDKQGNVVDVFEDPNLIMDLARIAMSTIISGVGGAEPINKIVLGTEGHNGDILTPKTSAEGFTKDRTQLFSEESGAFNYPISFTPDNVAIADAVVISEPDTGTIVNRAQVGTEVTYTVTLPILAGNGTGAIIYTEAALYAGTNIFSMKTFNGRIKDDTVSLRITWKISF